MPFNGPGKETNLDLPDGLVYCVQCGTIFVYDLKRDCPSCTLAEMIEEISEQADDLQEVVNQIDDRPSVLRDAEEDDA